MDARQFFSATRPTMQRRNAVPNVASPPSLCNTRKPANDARRLDASFWPNTSYTLFMAQVQLLQQARTPMQLSRHKRLVLLRPVLPPRNHWLARTCMVQDCAAVAGVAVELNNPATGSTHRGALLWVSTASDAEQGARIIHHPPFLQNSIFSRALQWTTQH